MAGDEKDSQEEAIGDASPTTQTRLDHASPTRCPPYAESGTASVT